MAFARLIEGVAGLARDRGPEHELLWLQGSDPLLQSYVLGERGECGREPFCPEALPGVLALPDLDDAEPFLGRAGGVED